MPLRTPLCDLLGIDVPILNVGFGWSATPELAAAVSNAGGLGVLGLGVPPDESRKRISRTRELTRRPFGGNIIIAAFHSPHATEEQREARRASIATALAERVPVLVLFWGDPAPFVGPAHAAGTKVLLQAGSAEEVAHAARSGVDAVIIQGREAGGHVRATRSIWEVLPEAVRVAGSTPVLASGGIGDGASIAQAFRMGAQGVSLGTRFVASAEAWIHPHYKARLVRARGRHRPHAGPLLRRLAGRAAPLAEEPHLREVGRRRASSPGPTPRRGRGHRHAASAGRRRPLAPVRKRDARADVRRRPRGRGDVGAAAPTWAQGSASRRARTCSTSASSSALLLLATTAGARDREPAQSARCGW